MRKTRVTYTLGVKIRVTRAKTRCREARGGRPREKYGDFRRRREGGREGWMAPRARALSNYMPVNEWIIVARRRQSLIYWRVARDSLYIFAPTSEREREGEMKSSEGDRTPVCISRGVDAPPSRRQSRRMLASPSMSRADNMLIMICGDGDFRVNLPNVLASSCARRCLLARSWRELQGIRQSEVTSPRRRPFHETFSREVSIF